LMAAWSELVGIDVVQQIRDGARRRTPAGATPPLTKGG
jgi:hypothetical protein